MNHQILISEKELDNKIEQKINKCNKENLKKKELIDQIDYYLNDVDFDDDINGYIFSLQKYGKIVNGYDDTLKDLQLTYDTLSKKYDEQLSYNRGWNALCNSLPEKVKRKYNIKQRIITRR